MMKLNRRLNRSGCLSLSQTSLRVTTAHWILLISSLTVKGFRDHQNAFSCSQSSCWSRFMIQTPVLYLNTDYLHFYPLIYIKKKKVQSFLLSLLYFCILFYTGFTNFSPFFLLRKTIFTKTGQLCLQCYCSD